MGPSGGPEPAPCKEVAPDEEPAPCEEAAADLRACIGEPLLWELDFEAFRARESRESAAALEALAASDSRFAAPVSIEQIEAGGVPARLYSPPQPAGGGLLVWLHGGAWILGGVEVIDPLVRLLVASCGSCVLSVDYRLAPEHRFPAAIDDAWSATSWAASRFGVIAVGGESAGGNLAAAVAVRARDRGVPLALQALIVPVLDYTVNAAAYAEYARRYSLFGGIPDFGATIRREMEFAWETYVPDPADRELPDAVPMRAASLAGLAPAVIVTAEHDMLREEAQRYAARLRSDGVAVEMHDYRGQVHSFIDHLDQGCDGASAVETVAAAVRGALGAAAARQS
jgi:acetyl esterase